MVNRGLGISSLGMYLEIRVNYIMNYKFKILILISCLFFQACSSQETSLPNDYDSFLEAVQANNLEAVNFFLNKENPKFDTYTNKESTKYIYTNGSPEAFMILLGTPKFSVMKDKDYIRLIMMSLNDDKENLAAAILHKVKDINVRVIEGRTLLHESAARGFDLFTTQLLQAGAVVDLKDNLGLTPLDLSVMSGNCSITLKLVKITKSVEDNLGYYDALARLSLQKNKSMEVNEESAFEVYLNECNKN